MNFFQKIQELILLYQYDSLQEFKPFEPFHMTQRIEHFFLNMTQRIGLVSKWLKELNRVSKWLKEFSLFFSKWLKELNLFLKMTQNFCSLDLTQNCFFWLWFLDWYCFVYYDSNKLNLFSNTTQRIELFLLIDMTQRIVFSHMSHRIEHFFEHERIEPSSFFMTQRIEPFLKIIWLQDLKLLWIGRWNFLNLDQGIEAFSTISLKNDWPFLDMTLRVEPFFNMTHRIEPFFFFLKKKWFIEIEPFFTTWLENESFFSMTSRIFLFYKMYDSIKLIVFGKYDSKNWNFC